MTGIVIIIIGLLFSALLQEFSRPPKGKDTQPPPKKKILVFLSRAIAIIAALGGVAYNFCEYVLQPPDISPYNYEEIHDSPIEIEMRQHGFPLLPKIPLFDIYYTTDGSDPCDSESAVKYDGPFYIEESTSFTARCQAFGLLWGELLVPSPYYRVASEKGDFINVDEVAIHGPASMYVGDTVTMQVTVLPSDATDKKVYWFSSDTSIATVDRQSGLVHAVSASEKPIEITAKTNSGEISSSIRLTVQERAATLPSSSGPVGTVSKGAEEQSAPSVPSSSSSSASPPSYAPPPSIPPLLSAIEIYPKPPSLLVGDDCQLGIIPYPSDADPGDVTWESQNPNVADVSPFGLITGISAGTTRITAFADGCNSSIYVEILSDTIEVERVVASNDSVVLEPYGSSMYVDAYVLPVNATEQRLQWYSDNEEIVQVDGAGLLIPRANGSTTVHVMDWSGRHDWPIEVKVTASLELPDQPEQPTPMKEPHISASADRYSVAEYGSVNITLDITTPDYNSLVLMTCSPYPDNSAIILLNYDFLFAYNEYTEVCKPIRICPAEYELSPGIYTFFVRLQGSTDNECYDEIDSDTFQIEVY